MQVFGDFVDSALDLIEFGGEVFGLDDQGAQDHARRGGRSQDRGHLCGFDRFFSRLDQRLLERQVLNDAGLAAACFPVGDTVMDKYCFVYPMLIISDNLLKIYDFQSTQRFHWN